jgi:hypothetical protein
MTKVSDEAFWNAFRENAGNYAATARALVKKYNLDSYSRTSVWLRAHSDKEKLNEIIQEELDLAEHVLAVGLRSRNERVRVDTAKFVLKHKGKERGYTERTEVTGANGSALSISVVTQDDNTRNAIDNL